MEKYRYWNILEELPEGGGIDNITGSPAPKTVFITNGENILSGKQKRALLRVCKINQDISVSKIVEQLTSFVEPIKKTEKTEPPICPPQTLNDLARPMNDYGSITIKDEIKCCPYCGKSSCCGDCY